MNVFRTYIEFGARINIAGSGCIEFEAGGERIYITRGCDITASGGQIVVGAGFFMNKGCSIVSHKKIQIGRDVMFGPNVAIYDSDHRCEIGDKPFRKQGYVAREVAIGSNVWVGQNTIVTKGSCIEDGTVVGANAVVGGRLATGHLYAGTPARMIKQLTSTQK